ncbi:hypothetical protein [Endothiovibrio diazotrophicus]
MLREITAVRQIPGEPRRRWFQDEAMDLFVWFEGETIVGFQLSYDKPDRERTLTWRRERGYDHARTDDGSRPGRHPATPILVADGVFDVARVAVEFARRAAGIDGAVEGFVVERIRRASGEG